MENLVPSSHATLNAALNLVSTVFLLFGYIMIRRQKQATHKKLMIAALVSSALFLVSYLVYHSRVGSVPYPYDDWTRTLYLVILIPHIILAALMVPFIITGVLYAFTKRFERHRRLMRLVWPVWMYVSVSGVLVYLMLYHTH